MLVLMTPHQVPGAVGSCQVTLDVRVEDLHGRLDEAAAGKVLVVLDERQPRLQQLVVGLHVNHVVLVQLSRDTGVREWGGGTSGNGNSEGPISQLLPYHLKAASHLEVLET